MPFDSRIERRVRVSGSGFGRVVRLSLAATVIAGLSACGSDGNGGSDSTQAAELGTLAYVVSRCRVEGDRVSFAQELRIRCGEANPITVWAAEGPSLDVEAPLTGFPLPVGLACPFAGQTRNGMTFPFVGPVQFVSVSPDGSRVAFEVAGGFTILPERIVQPDEEGIFVVNADGSELRRLAAPSVVSAFVLDTFSTIQGAGLVFSPSGGELVYVDEGPGTDGEAPLQVFLLNVGSGERRQLTHLPPGPPSVAGPNFPRTFSPNFLDERTIVFQSTSGLSEPALSRVFTVGTDGGDLRVHALPSGPAKDAEIIPVYAITGDRPDAFVRSRPDEPVNNWEANPLDTFIYGSNDFVRELWVLNGDEILQLTNFRRWDTAGIGKALGNSGERAFFIGSPDPFGTNPTQNCQIFSSDVIGGGLRQVTFFEEVEFASAGCASLSQQGYGCLVESLFQDPVADRLVFYSTCDPLGRNPNGGQIFAINHDGSDLRQLTDTRGMVEEANGSLSVELPMPFAYPSLRPGGRNR